MVILAIKLLMVILFSIFIIQVLLNHEIWLTCLVLVSGVKEHRLKSLVILSKLLKDGKLNNKNFVLDLAKIAYLLLNNESIVTKQ